MIVDIRTDDRLVPRSFIVHTFYGEKTCFCWNEDKLVIFPYANHNFVSVEVLTAPAPIKSILCFSGRVFFVCIPQGVYKLSRDRKFAVLSKSAVGMGSVFYQVLIPRNKYLYLDDKQDMTSKMLFQLSSEENDFSNLCICPLSMENATEQFVRALTNNDSATESLCIIGDGKKLLTLAAKTVRIIYNSTYSIRSIVPILQNCKADGLLLLTDTDVIIAMYWNDDAFSFERISLGVKVQAICARFSQLSKDTFWIIYSDESKLYCTKKQLLANKVQRMIVEDKSFVCLQCYDSRTILRLTADKQLVELSTATVERMLSVENDNFINLRSDMLKGTELVMQRICEGTEELHALNETLLAEEDKLRRINMYAHKHRARSYPNVSVHRIANQVYLTGNFSNMLPKRSWVILNLRYEHENVYSMKKVVDQETVVDIHVPKDKAANFLELAIDLVTLKEEEHPWGLIRNYVTDPLPEKTKKKKRKTDKTNFVNSKIATLQNLIDEGHIDMEKLSAIKKSIRKEFNVT